MSPASHQDAKFEVTEIAGELAAELFALGESAVEMRPETLIMRTATNRWHRCFLDAFIGFWHALTEEQAAEVFEDYEDIPRVDLLARFGLGQQHLLQATCDRTAAGTRISIVFETGSVILREIDPRDPDSESVLEFHPR